jgi:hypothetical protein
MRFNVACRQNKGSITVEASLIVPFVIISILAVIYMGLLLYQRAQVQSAADMAAEAGAAVWASGVSEIDTGKPKPDSFEEIKLYRRIFDNDIEERLASIESFALSTASRNELLHPIVTDSTAVIKDYAVCRKLEITVVKYYHIPLGNLLKIFGGSGAVEIRVKALSSIDEPVEFIRTTDFILDLEKKLENNNPSVRNLGDKTRNEMSEIKGKLENFLN